METNDNNNNNNNDNDNDDDDNNSNINDYYQSYEEFQEEFDTTTIQLASYYLFGNGFFNQLF